MKSIPPRTRNPRTLRDASNASVSLTRPVTALAALALLTFLVPLPPPAQAVTCGPAQRGNLNANNTFSLGTSARHNDYRVICRGDGGGREVTADDISNALNHPNADPEADYTNRFVLQLTNAYLNWGYDSNGTNPLGQRRNFRTPVI